MFRVFHVTYTYHVKDAGVFRSHIVTCKISNGLYDHGEWFPQMKEMNAQEIMY